MRVYSQAFLNIKLRGDSRTPHVQQVYNTSLTWVGPIMCGAHPM
jgi:hypothetical protein